MIFKNKDKNSDSGRTVHFVYIGMQRYQLQAFLICILLITGCSVPSNQHGLRASVDVPENRATQSKIINTARAVLDKKPVTVTDKREESIISDPRNYVSLACYWWPDAATENGLPYIRRDGAVNPETRSEQSDLPRLIEMAQRVEKLAEAYRLTGEEPFAEKAVEQLIAWFVDTETAMLPHLEHAQMVRGVNQGRSYGVIDTWWLIRVVDSIPELRRSDFWTSELESGLQAWFTHYLNWLRNSEFGQQERRSENNHGTWYDVQVVTFARFVSQHRAARYHLNHVTKERLPKQIARSGRQKFETRRPRPLHYSIYNLAGLIKLAQHGRELGVDLENRDRWYSGSLQDAWVYLVNRMEGVDPAGLMDPYDPTETDQMFYDLLESARALFMENNDKFNY